MDPFYSTFFRYYFFISCILSVKSNFCALTKSSSYCNSCWFFYSASKSLLSSYLIMYYFYSNFLKCSSLGIPSSLILSISARSKSRSTRSLFFSRKNCNYLLSYFILLSSRDALYSPIMFSYSAADYYRSALTSFKKSFYC
jgi:hypothetical protein